MTVPSEERTYWDATAGETTEFPQLEQDLRVDVAVVGGGIVGVATARALKDSGRSVALIEGRRVGRQVTGKSTAKVTSQHNLVYGTLARKFGQDHARLYAEAQQAGLQRIRDLAGEHGIECDLETRPAYTFTRDENKVAAIEEEIELARRLGLPALAVLEDDLPFGALAAIRFDDQAQFHPTKFVAGLARTLPGDGCHVFENSPVIDWEPTRVTTARATVRAATVVMATHMPLGQIGGYYTLAHPHAEPVIAAPIGDERAATASEGMYVSVEQPRHSVRTHRHPDGRLYAIAAGSSFKPGHTEDELASFQNLEAWLTEQLHTGPAEYRWVNEDYQSTDSVPFIGWSSAVGRGYLVATGFGAWGISNGSIAGTVLADLATGKGNRWTDLFNARRIAPAAGGSAFIKGNAEVAAHLVSGYLSRKDGSMDDLAPGHAAVMKIDGKRLAVFRDEGGRIHAVSAVCTHMGCLVGWNHTDRTWDCPCHGSRFDVDGGVIHGPAFKPLDPASAEQRAVAHASSAPRDGS